MTLNAENTTFNIAGKGLKLNTAEDVQEFVNSILELENLEKVVLSGNTFGVEAARAIAKALEQKNTLKVLDASDIFTGRLREEIPHAVKALCDSLEDKQLVELNFSDNAFGPAGVEPMVDFLTNNRQFEILKLNNNGLGPSGGKLAAKALLAAAEKNVAEGRKSSLTTIIAGRNRLENGSSQVLADAFAAHGTLTEIRIPQNGIRPEGIIALSKGLAACKNLEILDLQDNTFTEDGSKAFAEALVEWPKLKFLNIGDCLLSANGGVIIAETLLLGRNKNLEFLDLQSNEINSKGVRILASAVSSHLKKLESLQLNGNNVNPEDISIQNVRSALEENGHADALGELDDMECSEGEEEEEEEEEDLIEPPSLEELSIEDKETEEEKLEEDDIEDQERPPQETTIVDLREVRVERETQGSVIEIKSQEIKIQETDREIQKTILEVNQETREPVREEHETSPKDVVNVSNPQEVSREVREPIPEVKLQEVDREIREGDRGTSENTPANEQVEALTERVSKCHYL